MHGSVTTLASQRQRTRTRRRPEAPSDRSPRRKRRGGRMWINGREIGGTDARFAHLTGRTD